MGVNEEKLRRTSPEPAEKATEGAYPLREQEGLA